MKHVSWSRRAAIAVVAILAFGVVGGSALAHDGKDKKATASKSAGATQYGSMGQYQYGKRVVICHKGRTIVVSGSAVRTHLKRKSTLGPCAVEPRHGRKGKKIKKVKIVIVKRSDAGKELKAVKIAKPTSGHDHGDDDDDDDRDGDRRGKGRGED